MLLHGIESGSRCLFAELLASGFEPVRQPLQDVAIASVPRLSPSPQIRAGAGRKDAQQALQPGVIIAYNVGERRKVRLGMIRLHVRKDALQLGNL
ncbi:hypothetical protein ELE36_05965 [Pseudolysobacter antarcticus]|uniref:Uncharacterized protein n=1 Tax=Pseudolysobacter antarcticus TaxID=2511995 RepID=A0A411HHG8_9GAMM|nr:hypothetical protein [Pseudolysobacter antarcticus]QBB69943.1 hypothetical protein ELE36_05965 [Pseudolysobacter antarcticus]